MAVDFPIGGSYLWSWKKMRQSYLDYAMNVIVDRASGCCGGRLRNAHLYSLYELVCAPTSQEVCSPRRRSDG